jgi:UDP-glucose 4-epimerase
METSIVRFSNVYGKYDASDRVVPLFIAKSIRGENLTVFGDDKILDFTHIDDCVDGVMRVVNNFSKASGTTFNIASGRGTSLVELAEILVEITDSDVDIQVESNRTGEVARYVADISKAEQLLGYDPEYSTVDGLTATVDWYTERTELFDRIIN